MSNPSEKIADLQQVLYRSNSVEELLNVFTELTELFSSEILAAEAHNLALDIFRALRDLTADESIRGQELIIGYLLPYLDLDIPGDGRVEYIISRARDILEDWINHYPLITRTALRDTVLDHLVARLQTTPRGSVCSTLWHMGYRRPDIVAALWAVANQNDDKLGDLALVTITALGVVPDERPLLLATLHDRVPQRCNSSLTRALGWLADPSSLAVIQAHWLPPKATISTDPVLVLHTLADITDTHASNSVLQDQVWPLLVQGTVSEDPNIAESLTFWGDLAPHCDNPAVVPMLLTKIAVTNQPDQQMPRRRYLPYSLLADCVRPRQLASWAVTEDEAALAAVQMDACLNTGSAFRAQSEESLRKERAWETVLRWGRTEALAWFEEALGDEASPYVQEHLSERLACFRLDSLPEIITTWITERFDAHGHENDGQLLARMGAIRVARSAASREAFIALLDFGLTIDGQVLRDSGQALASVVIDLATAGDNVVVPALVQVALAPKEDRAYQQVAAIAALQTVAAKGSWLLESASAVRAYTFDETHTLDAYLRSTLVAALGNLLKYGFVFSAAELEQLKVWARVGQGWLSIRALEVLARTDALPREFEIMIDRLHLKPINGAWTVIPDATLGEWDARILGLLYRRQPIPFTPAVLTVIQAGEVSAVTRLLAAFEATHDAVQPLTGSLIEALIAWMSKQLARGWGDTEFFTILAKIAPERFALELWDAQWMDWQPELRATLADTLGSTTYPTPEAREQALTHVHRLAGDASYGVRRAACRALSRLDPVALDTAVRTWVSAPSVELRQWAAEASAWFDRTQATSFHELNDPLTYDPESPVREAARLARRERRDRAWADAYLARLLTIQEGSLDEILSAWCYAMALTELGDDTHIDSLEQHRESVSLPAHVDYWFYRIIKATHERWGKVTDKWKERWLPWDGTMEEGAGSLLSTEGAKYAVRYILWQQPARTPDTLTIWRGVLWLAEDTQPQGIIGGTRSLQLADGREGHVLITRMLNEVLNVVGTGPYPA